MSVARFLSDSSMPPHASFVPLVPRCLGLLALTRVRITVLLVIKPLSSLFGFVSNPDLPAPTRAGWHQAGWTQVERGLATAGPPLRLHSAPP